MNTKIQKRFIDNGFGFPVHLLNVPMVKIRGHWTPNIKYNKLSDFLFDALAHKPSKLTGEELKFIRLKLKMTLKEFANKFYVTHPCVLKWENKKGEPTGMNWVTEKDIRLFIFSITSKKKDFLNEYKHLRQQASNKVTKTKIDLSSVDEPVLV